MRKRNHNELRKQKLINDINSIQQDGCIKIFAGEGNCFVYDNDEVYNAFKEAIKRGVSCKIILGPVLSISESTGKTKLEDLAKEGLEIYFKPWRHTLFHYRVFTGENGKLKCYVETSHPPLESGKPLSKMNSPNFAEELYKEFDDFIKLGKLESYTNLRSVFIPLKPSEIKHLHKYSERKLRLYDYISNEEIKDMLKESVHPFPDAIFTFLPIKL